MAGTYLYWTVRIFIEAALFCAVLFTVERYLKQLLPEWGCYLLAALLSLVPFALAITMMDLIIGLPELGFNGDTSITPDEKGWAFGLEIIYLLDNHLLLSALFLMPRLLLSGRSEQIGVEVNNAQQSTQIDDAVSEDPDLTTLTFFDSLEPPLEGHVCSMEAQEHYILVVTTEESRMILHRFSDAVRQTPVALGMQVHRSHWVAHSAVREVVTEGQNMKLRLIDDKVVPVSRTFRVAVESRYSAVKAASCSN